MTTDLSNGIKHYVRFLMAKLDALSVEINACYKKNDQLCSEKKEVEDKLRGARQILGLGTEEWASLCRGDDDAEQSEAFDPIHPRY